MNLFAMGDLHLPGGQDKPMSVFGPQWDDHFRRVSEDWQARVKPEDTVLIPGDISWAMQLTEAREDLEKIGLLPGRKVLIRGNHDYWWGAITRVREAMPEGMIALQQDAFDLGDLVVCGTRGWMIPTAEATLDEGGGKRYRRELGRLKTALERADSLARGRPVVAMLHYPPLMKNQMSSGFTELLEQAGVRVCVYGHLHGAGIQAGFSGEQRGVRYELTSCDSLRFQMKKINFL